MRSLLFISIALMGACAGNMPAPEVPEAAARPALTHAQLTEIAAAFEARGDVVRAEQYWRLALQQGAEADKVLPQLLSVFVRDKQYRLALQHAREYLKTYPKSDSLRLLTGAICEAVGDYGAAVEQYQVVATRRGLYADVHYVLAEALVKQGTSLLEADQHFRRYLELAPTGRYAERAQASLLKELVQ
jgi:tetratricopeptide (TPR) repeat protein